MKPRLFLMFAVLVLLPIAVGSVTYVGWRTTSLLVFDWMIFLGIPKDVFRPEVNLPTAVLYSLPDGCWVFAGTSWLLIIWRRCHPWALTYVVLAIGGELGQAFCLVPGTFEWMDIVFYVAGFILALIGYRHAEALFVGSRIAGNGHSCSG